MRKFISTIFLLALFLAPASALPSTFKAEIIPPKVAPGDIFLIRLTVPEKGPVPSASMDGVEFLFSSCGDGCYLGVAAADFLTKPGVHKLKVRDGSDSKDVDVVIIEKKFPTEKLTLAPGKVFLSAKDQKRVDVETAKQEAIWAKKSPKLWSGDFQLPLKSNINTVFGIKRLMNGKKTSYHRGIDMRGATGDPIHASNSGVVALSENLFYGGNTIIVDHGQGIFTVYMHLSRFASRVGERVKKGQIIGYVGSTGRASGPHLHFSVKLRNLSVNPESLVGLDL